jgi:ABC-2 type transport system permease protein
VVTATADRRETPVSGTPAPPAPRRGGVWWRVFRHHLRLLRNASITWIVVLAGTGAGVVATFEDRVPTEADRQAAAALEGVPAFEALFGRFTDPGSLEGFVLARWGMFAILVAVWAMLAAVKVLRGAEEAGHAEPLRAGTLTPRRTLLAAVAALFTWYALLAVAIGIGHSAAGMDPATAWTLGGAMGLLAASFAGVGALASQVAASRQRAVRLAGAVLGVALAVRVLAAASGTPAWVWWTTPFGWAGFLHEVDQARPAVFGAFVSLVVLLVAAAVALARRDLHFGFVAAGDGGSVRAAPVGGQLRLAVRLTRASVLGWGAVLAAAAFAFAALAHDFAGLLADMPDATELYERMGYAALDTAEGIVTLVLGWFFVAGVALFSAAQIAAIREEEASWRIEQLLVRPVGRVRWLTTRTLAAAVGVIVISVAVAVAVWVGSAVGGPAIATVDAALVGINLIPAALLFLGLGILLHGLLPRLAGPLAFGLVVGAYLLDFVGPLLELPDAVIDLSPFRHLAPVPVADVDLVAAGIMLAVGITGTVIGLVAFRHRDLKEA